MALTTPTPATLCLPAAFHGENPLATFPNHAKLPEGVSPLSIRVQGSIDAHLQGTSISDDREGLFIALASQKPIVTPTLPVESGN